ncbi:DNA repair protein XRCC2-like [Limulus polyphemus]|uniref:DNA repair protein XRCC2-like n=1 Tax=Limulus polyphemus TaxID=6850 RepID=A0ABM1BXS0_LIMPO|nr:DNA repair protein XRCC2-like [Limulus polyphemus]
MENSNVASEVSPIVKCETGSQLLARLSLRPSLKKLEPALFPDLSGQCVVEISGGAGAGKSELFYHLIAKCILPPSWQGTELGGLSAGVVFVDTDHHFNLLRLVTVLEKRVASKLDSPSVEEVTVFIRKCLQMLTIVRCWNSEQLLLTLYGLDSVIGTNVSISLLLLDSVSAFYWLDRMNLMDQMNELDKFHAQLVAALEKLVNNYKLVVMATRQVLMKERETDAVDDKNRDKLSFKRFDFMGRNWQKFVKCRLTLKKEQTEEVGQTKITICKFDSVTQSIECLITENGMMFLT